MSLAVLLTLPLSAQFPQQFNDEEKRLFQAFINTYHLIRKHSIHTNHLESQDLIISAISGMVDSLKDPYSVLLQGKALDQFYKNLDDHFSGIGIYIVTNERGVLIIDVIQNSPAWTIGLRAQDLIIKVGKVEVKGKKPGEVRNLILGPENSLIVITVLRKKKELTFNVMRKNIKVRTVQTKILSSKPNIAYIRIQTFAQNTDEEFSDALNWAKSRRATGIVIDVRNNPGGLLPVVIKMVDTFISKGTVVSTRSVNAPEKLVRVDPQIDFPTFIPVVVLVNRYSASASEIFAGALKDHRRAVIVGEKSFGKFSVQKLFPILNNKQKNVALKLTIARYFLPNGDSFDKIGIPPHVTVTNQDFYHSSNPDSDKENVDLMLDTAISILTDSIRYRELLKL